MRDRRRRGEHVLVTMGDVFASDIIETWLDEKRTNEVNAAGRKPTLALSFDA